MATLRVIAESPTKLVLEMDSPTRANWADSRGYLLYPLLSLALVFLCLSTYKPPIWLYWVIAAGVLLFVSFVLYVIFTSPQEATVIIDLMSGRATRIEKSVIGRKKKQELELGRVSRILINAEEVGHHYRVILESQSKPHLEVNFAIDSEAESFRELGKKIGSLLNKPVVFKHTDSGNLISEETLQS